ncbi:hypothetical protein, conserved [Entamoeba histolytica]
MEEINTDESSNRRYITRINTEVIPIFRYSASVVNWKITDLDKIDLEIRKYLRKAKYIGAGNSKDCLYVIIEEMGEGLINISDEYVIELVRTRDGTVRRECGIEFKTSIHKIPETKIEEIINEGIEKKKEKEVVVEIKIIDRPIHQKMEVSSN